MHLAIPALSLATVVYKYATETTETKETNVSNKCNKVKNPNWQKADQLAINNAWPRILNLGLLYYQETNPASSRVEALRKDLCITPPVP